MADGLSELYQFIRATIAPSHRPYLTLTYAQSLDGCVTVKHGHQTPLSSSGSLAMTHTLRAIHDGILVGIGTVLTDDPQLTVRHASGQDPQPVVLDTRLRFPGDAHLARNRRPPWLLCGPDIDNEQRCELEAQGIQVISVAVDARGRLDGPNFLQVLRDRGIQRLMVEGGARVISYFYEEQLADLLVLTVTPLLLAGPRVVAGDEKDHPLAKILSPRWQQVGPDMVVWGEIEGRSP